MKKPKTTTADRRLAATHGSRHCVRCGCCEGTGKVSLGDDLWRTLQRLNATPKTTAQLQEKGITRNAINNRLIDLEAHGLAVCVGKQGKWRMWCAVNAKVEQPAPGETP